MTGAGTHGGSSRGARFPRLSSPGTALRPLPRPLPHRCEPEDLPPGSGSLGIGLVTPPLRTCPSPGPPSPGPAPGRAPGSQAPPLPGGHAPPGPAPPCHLPIPAPFPPREAAGRFPALSPGFLRPFSTIPRRKERKTGKQRGNSCRELQRKKP